MSNCAATYAHQCLTGMSQIWSIRTPNGARLATLETCIDESGPGMPRIRIRQQAGPGNSKPLPGAIAAAHELCGVLGGQPALLGSYLQWKATNGKIPVSERRFAASIGVIVDALDEVLPPQWCFERLVRGALLDGDPMRGDSAEMAAGRQEAMNRRQS